MPQTVPLLSRLWSTSHTSKHQSVLHIGVTGRGTKLWCGIPMQTGRNTGWSTIIIIFRNCWNSDITFPTRIKWHYVILRTCENQRVFGVGVCHTGKHCNQFKNIPFSIDWAARLWQMTGYYLSKLMKCLQTVLSISLKYLAGAECLNLGCRDT